MPLFHYCSSCGYANAYVSQKPNFCGKCGNNTTAAIKVPVQPSIIVPSAPTKVAGASSRPSRFRRQEEEDDGEYEFLSPELEQTLSEQETISYTIAGVKPAQEGIKMKEAIFESPQAPQARKKGKKINTKKALNEILKKASTGYHQYKDEE